MYRITLNDHDCYGCLACKDVCPVNAITVKKDIDGYLYPDFDITRCINCNRCNNACPSGMSDDLFNMPIGCFAGIHNDYTIWKQSASGGAFPAIVAACKEYFGNIYKKFYCVGCKYDSNFQVIQDVCMVEGYDSIKPFLKSKYVFSNSDQLLDKCLSIVNDKNNFLICSGTPCQIAALKKNIKTENVIFVDLICHGAPSQLYFDSYIKKLESDTKSKLTEYEFRTKETLENGTLYTRSSRYRLSNGLERRVSRLEDPYLISFYNEDYPERASCSTCEFKRPERISDITIGDAWGIQKAYPELNPVRGISVIIENTEIAKKIEPLIRKYMSCYEMTYEFIMTNNPPLRRML